MNEPGSTQARSPAQRSASAATGWVREQARWKEGAELERGGDDAEAKAGGRAAVGLQPRRAEEELRRWRTGLQRRSEVIEEEKNWAGAGPGRVRRQQAQRAGPKAAVFERVGVEGRAHVRGQVGTRAGEGLGWPSIADYLSRDLPNKLSPDDVYLTSGCAQAIEIICSVLARPGANILLPRPGYLFYEARAVFNGMEARYFDLLPEKDWEVDIAGVQALADKNTIAMVIVNPGNPCGNVYTYEHLAKASAAKLFCVAETARKLGIFVITDEVYAHLTFGEKKFVPMGMFGSVAPVLTLGAISKRWVVPGWRLGWIVTNDRNGVFQRTKVVDSIKSYLDISSDPPTFVQVGKFFGMIQVKLDLSCLQNIKDDMDFCCRLAKEELVVVLPGCAVGHKNWLRITFAIAPSSLEDGLDRLKSFCLRYSKPNK
ncbi:hypothetical protein PR202_ga22196 [Eleusine coracana subsp. coracana]|uniref:Aminotransferase class I/classII large domain-containing protein n=1 Tax=Eleusine coracana subsp. coracana TaxID=191504 RepID=A0AAV5D2X2_ELECO|nr:hypothetical protein PR202_ga22196 [Eleusine coracana subsp. coracana]